MSAETLRGILGEGADLKTAREIAQRKGLHFKWETFPDSDAGKRLFDILRIKC